MILALLLLAGLEQAPRLPQAPPAVVDACCDIAACECGCASGEKCKCAEHRAAGWSWDPSRRVWWRVVPPQASAAQGRTQQPAFALPAAPQIAPTYLPFQSFGTPTVGRSANC
jgi:hypothetical protein